MERYERLTTKGSNYYDDRKVTCAEEIYEQLKDLEDKIENGTLLQFPRIVKNVGYYSFWSVEYINKKFGSVSVDFFATKDEAEAKLKELVGELK